MTTFLTASQLSTKITFPSCEFTTFNPKSKYNICLYVGSFDPPHIGHQNVVSLLLNQKDIDYVMIVPTYNHCTKENVSDFGHRVNMISLAFSKTLNVLICPVEKHLTETYNFTKNITIDTIEFLKSIYNNSYFSIAMGSDLFNTLSTWKHIDKYSSIPFNIITRQNNIIDADNMSILSKLNIPYRFLNNSYPICDISSSNIKKMIVEGQYIGSLMSYEVYKYIELNPNLIETFQKSYKYKQKEQETKKTLNYDNSFC